MSNLRLELKDNEEQLKILRWHLSLRNSAAARFSDSARSSRYYCVWCIVVIPAALTVVLVALLMLYCFMMEKTWHLAVATDIVKTDEPKQQDKPEYGENSQAGKYVTHSNTRLPSELYVRVMGKKKTLLKRSVERLTALSQVRVQLISVPMKSRYSQRAITINQHGIVTAKMYGGKSSFNHFTSFELIRWRNGKYSLRSRDAHGGRIQFLAGRLEDARPGGCRQEKPENCLKTVTHRLQSQRLVSSPFFNIIPEASSRLQFSIEFVLDGVNRFLHVRNSGVVLLKKRSRRTKFRFA